MDEPILLERAMSAIPFLAGGFSYAPGVFQYSAGVRALPHHTIERVRFARVVPMAEGFRRIAAFLTDRGRPLTAFCACELRSPAPFTEDGFLAFNRAYATVLTQWGLISGDANPVARSNVCPEIDKPAEPGFHGFCFTSPSSDVAASFVVAGSGEAREGQGNYRDHTVRPGDVSPDGLRAKADFVMSEMERRMAVLGVAWPDVTATQIYTVHNIHPFLPDLLVRRGAARHGLTWHYARPPVVGLDYEMDCRGVAAERVLPA
jgi:hypothetical protein